MLIKMILKLLFKASVPLVLIAGVSFYMLSSKGIDPVALVKQALPAQGVSVSGAFGDARDLVSSGANIVSGAAGSSSIGQKDTLYRWKDENGVTQFSNVAPNKPTGVSTIVVNPNQNVIASLPKKEKPASNQSPTTQAAAHTHTQSHTQSQTPKNPSKKTGQKTNAESDTRSDRGRDLGLPDGSRITSGEQLPGVAGEMLKGVDVSRILGNLD